MRKGILAALALLFCTASAMQATDRKVSKITSTTSGVSYDHYLYNPDGQLMWVQSTTTNNRFVYSYNTKGQLVSKTTLSWIAADHAYKELNRETYTYGEDGHMKRMDQVRNLNTSYESSRYYLYTAFDAQGDATAWQHYNDKGVLYYEYQVEKTLDEKGNVTMKTIKEFDPDYPEDGWYLSETHAYTYQENGDIKTEQTIIYKSDGTVKTTTDYTYDYADLAPTFAPTGLKAAPQGNNILLSWDAVEGASEYVVTYDMEHKTVSGTSFTATDIAIGDHEFTVQAIVNGEEKNAAAPVTCALSDAGRLPAENLTAGQPRVSVEDTDEGTPRTFYVIPLSWTFPANHSEIKDIRIYYNSAIFGHKYVSVQSKTATSYELKLDEYDVRRTDEQDNYTCGADMEFYITIIYGSGESEASNTLKLNPYNLATGKDDPDAIHLQGLGAAMPAYTIGGQRASEHHKGLVIQGGKKLMKR